MTLEASTQADTDRTILIMDDDASFVTALRDGLGEFGWHVAVADSQEEAWACAEKRKWAIHAVLVDVTMPGPDSVASFARRIQAKIRGIRVVFVSGFSQESLDTIDHSLPPAGAFLQKPFRIRDLLPLLDPARRSVSK